MKRSLAVVAALALVLATFTPALAEQPCSGEGWSNPCLEQYYARYCAGDCYADSESHPFRVLAYLLNPVGVALEWVIFRPLHWVVSQPNTAPIFGHTCDYIE